MKKICETCGRTVYYNPGSVSVICVYCKTNLCVGCALGILKEGEIIWYCDRCAKMGQVEKLFKFLQH